MRIGTARSDGFEFRFNRGLQSLPLALLPELLGERGGVGGGEVGTFGVFDGGGSGSTSGRGGGDGVGGLAGPGEGAIVEGRRVERRGLVPSGAFGGGGG